MADTEKLESLKNRRKALRSTVTKIINKIENLLKNENVTIEDLDENLETLNNKFKALKTTENDLDLLMDPIEIEKEYENSEKYSDNVASLKFQMNKRIREIKDKMFTSGTKQEQVFESENSVRQGNNNMIVKLPKLTLNKFDGNVHEWLTFWNTFESSIHSNKFLSNVDKFNYLKAHLFGNALKTVEGFPISDATYNSAISLLKERYGNEEMLKHAHMSNLLAIKPLKNSSDIVAFRKFYDNLSTQIRNLESLGTDINNISSVLCTSILKCIPQDLLIELSKSGNEDGYNNIKHLLEFLSKCLNAREKAILISNSVGDGFRKQEKMNMHQFKERKTFTASDLVTTNKNERSFNSCIFCESQSHSAMKCSYALNLTVDERKNIIMRKGGCFKCLDRKKHISRFCKKNIICSHCKGNHNSFFCYSFHNVKKSENSPKIENECNETTLLSNQPVAKEIYLQTLFVYVNNNSNCVRAILDTASSKSYISKFVASKLHLKSIGEIKVTHGLFGGSETTVNHHRYNINLKGLREGKSFEIEVMEQDKICATVPKIKDFNCIRELRNKNIFLSDICPESRRCLYERDSNEIHILLGADVVGKLFTGKIENLFCGLVAMQTKLGWITMGKINNSDRDSSLLVLSLCVNDAKITDLWNLDSLGIIDPVEKQTKEETQKIVLKHFEDSVSRENDGRYKVCLPWKNGYPSIPDNKEMSEKRLRHNVKNLKNNGLLENYQQVFDEWEEEGVIRKVEFPESLQSNESVHYLPHRAVIKPNSTTQIRPVFDGGAHAKNFGSINDYLEKGPNLIELIPSVLNRFRMGKIGVVADIRRAFLQISLNEKDRKYLRFLWWRDGNPENLVVYEHCRVVFGISSSPFLLAATLMHHLDQAPENVKGVALKLKESLYVDNCVASVESFEELEYFRNEARKLLSSAKFDLRGWCNSQSAKPNLDEVGNCDSNYGISNSSNGDGHKISLLGLMWDTRNDTLSCDFRNFEIENESITKRTILSITHKIFDPIGFTCPLTLIPKLILQKCWKIKISWDSKLPDEIIKDFEKWKNQMNCLEKLSIPRRLSDLSLNEGNLSIHIFCDACKSSYATCIFIRNQMLSNVTCQLVQARSKVAPLKNISIPRLELLACCIGARLADTVKSDLKLENVKAYYWSDSMDALHWIKGDGPWGTFVANRVKEIRKLSDMSSWNFVPGNMNPADLPSRGCHAKYLLESQWWLGPKWLLEYEENWPKININPNIEIINSEKKKTKLITATNLDNNDINFYDSYSSYTKILRITAWILRFLNNIKLKTTEKQTGNLSVKEIDCAEKIIIKKIQESLPDETIKYIQTFVDPEGLIRIKSKISHRDDLENFRFPILLPAKHPLVKKLILAKHLELSHAGIQILMSVLRENFWIIKTRKTVRQAIRNCTICNRFRSHPVKVLSPPLPTDRIKDARIFQVTGVDLCGPLHLKDGRKSWIALFTCAIYRGVHLELLTSLSTECLVLALRRFIGRRGRPEVIYSDNGTNMVGVNNELKSIDWEKIEDFASIKKIQWKFNPPSAPWWGGFWERMIGLVKQMLRKVLGRASVDYEELTTILCDTECVINSRPLTYLSEDPEELVALTPSMFMQEIPETSMADFDQIDSRKFNKRYQYRLKLCQDLRNRFRSEYLGQLKDSTKNHRESFVKEGEIVLIGDTNIKRINWPLAKIIKLHPGKDGKPRLVEVKTKTGILLRPVQRLYPLEVRKEESSLIPQPPPDSELIVPCESSDPDSELIVPCASPVREEAIEPKNRSSRGRLLKLPQRFGQNV